MDAFLQRKLSILKEIDSSDPDKSRKGGLDEPIIPLVTKINESHDFVTTSSCSGRISVFLEPTKGQREEANKKVAFFPVN